MKRGRPWLELDPNKALVRGGSNPHSLLFIFIKGVGLVSFKKYASKKVIAIVMAVMLAVGAFFNQQHKINDL